MGEGLCIHLLDAGRCPHCHGLAPALKQRSARIAQRMAESRDRAAWLAGYEAARAQAADVCDDYSGFDGYDVAGTLADAIRSMTPHTRPERGEGEG